MELTMLSFAPESTNSASVQRTVSTTITSGSTTHRRLRNIMNSTTDKSASET